MTQERRFPAPWTVEEYRGISYIRDANRRAISDVRVANENHKPMLEFAGRFGLVSRTTGC
jgi:hypothetical protein